MRVFGFISLAVIALLGAALVVVLIREVPSITRYLRIRRM